MPPQQLATACVLACPAALAVGFGAYTYESLVLAKEGAAPLRSEMARRPDIKSLK
jgi:hypothetical protein